MTTQLPEFFIPKYTEEVKIRAQQELRVLDGTTTDFGVFIGDDLHIPRFGAVDTYKSTRLAAVALANGKMDWVKKNAEPEFVAFGLWDPDKNKLSIMPNAAGLYAQASVRAVNRAHDRQIIDELHHAAENGVVNTKGETETILTLGDYETVADLELICEAIVALGTRHQFVGETISIVCPFKVQVQNSLDPYLAKTDVKGNRPWDNLKWCNYELLPGNGPNKEGWLLDPDTNAPTGATGCDIFIYAKSAVTSLSNDKDVPINERLGAQLADMIGQWFQAAAMVTEPKGVIRIKTKLDFELLRKAIPIIDMDP